MGRKKFKLINCLIIVLSVCSNNWAQMLLDSDLMIQEIDLDEQNLLPEKEIIYMRGKRDDEDVGSGSFDFIQPFSHLKPNKSTLLNATRAINLDSITLVLGTNQNSKFQNMFILIASSIGGLIAISLFIGIFLIFYYVKKRSPISSSQVIPSAPPHHTDRVLAFDHHETNTSKKKSKKINVINTTMTEIEI